MTSNKMVMSCLIALMVMVGTELAVQNRATPVRSISQQSTVQATDAAGREQTGEDVMSPGIQRTTEFHNEYVTVVRYRFAAHATIPMHDAPNAAVIWLTDGHLRLKFPDGTRRDLNFKAGETTWDPAGRHAGENLADIPLEFIAVQLATANGSTPSAAPSSGTQQVTPTSEEKP